MPVEGNPPLSAEPGGAGWPAPRPAAGVQAGVEQRVQEQEQVARHLQYSKCREAKHRNYLLLFKQLFYISFSSVSPKQIYSIVVRTFC